MRYHVLACDYDGTLATHGRVQKPTLEALERVLASGRNLVLVTGRTMKELLEVFSQLNLFEWVVAENGALLYRPASREQKVFGDPPPEAFLVALDQHKVQPLVRGHVIVASWHPHENTMLDIIRDLGLEYQVIFNKDAVMVLPGGINKATGLANALHELGISPHNVVGIGDAENDHAFLGLCECAVAVANALPMLKEHADFVTEGGHGQGVAELIDELVANDLEERDSLLTRHHLLLGTHADGTEYRLAPYGTRLLVAGPSGSGKSTVATGLLERLAENHYQFCIIDPEGDYQNLEQAIVLGDVHSTPSVDEVLRLLKNPDDNVVVNLVGLPIVDRPRFFMQLLPRLQEMRARNGRPHWLIVDEAHHLLPASWEPGASTLPQDLDRLLLITVHPNQVAPAILSSINTVAAVGKAPDQTLGQFAEVIEERPPKDGRTTLQPGEVLVWRRHDGEDPFRLKFAPGRTERRRHVRKYAEGELPPDRSFFFQGRDKKLNLRAKNLISFIQLAEGVDDETWMHHLQKGDYSHWFRNRIKDENLAAEAERVESLSGLAPGESRRRIKAVIEEHYTLPASAPLPMPGTDVEGNKVSA